MAMVALASDSMTSTQLADKRGVAPGMMLSWVHRARSAWLSPLRIETPVSVSSSGRGVAQLSHSITTPNRCPHRASSAACRPG